MWQNTKGWSGWPWSGGKWQTSGWKRLAGISGAANDALRAFYDAMGGDSWTDNTGWGTSSAAYFGVTISSGTVTAISLPGNNLDGDASNTLDPLAGTLATLDLGQNTALDDIDVSQVSRFDQALRTYARQHDPDLLKTINETLDLTPEIEDQLKKLIADFKEQFSITGA